jgi:uncharacterized protein (DUF2062 family)
MKLKSIRQHLLKLDWDNREAVARGLAIGFCIGMLPFFGAQIILAIAVAHLLKGSRAAALLMTLLSNPLTLVPLYAACYSVGVILFKAFDLPVALKWPNDIHAAVTSGSRLYFVLLAGSAAIGIFGGVLSYLIAHAFPPIGLWQKPTSTHLEDDVKIAKWK